MVNRLHRSAERLLLITGLILLAVVAAAFAQRWTRNVIRQAPERGSASMHRPIRILLKGQKR